LPEQKDLLRFPFDSNRKRMSTVLVYGNDELNENGYNKVLHCKGAAEIVLAACNFYLDSNGNKCELDDSHKSRIETQIKDYCKEALRCIAFAYKDLKENEGGPNHEDIEQGDKIYNIEKSDMVLIGIVGIKDIIREEVPKAVEQCQVAGVRVRMVTGDNKVTAIAIAKECGIIGEGEEEINPQVCMTGEDFNKYVGGIVDIETKQPVQIIGKEKKREMIGNLAHMKLVRQNLKVLARSKPADKYVMVAGLRQLGDIVAVTGDGTNDAPAMKRADVGFAMATGTQVAATAADIIIQDDNFASIVAACKWGRNIYDNIRRFLQFQLTVNVVALITSFIASVVMKDTPLKAVQLLWVNMIMDSLASLALATERPTEILLQRPPYRKKEYIISRKMVKHILGQAIFQAMILFIFVFAGDKFVPEDQNMPNLKYEAAIGDTGKYETREFVMQEIVNPENKEMIISGMLANFDMTPLYSKYSHITPSRHLTIVFNMFVWLQIFNMLCARKINDEFNFLEGVTGNSMFIGVLGAIAGL